MEIAATNQNTPDDWVTGLEFEVGDYSALTWGEDLINSSAVVVVGSNQEISPSKGLTRLAQKVMKQGIAKLQQKNPKHALRIVLNNWDRLTDSKIP